jgi:pimeloyl-ACP methyl ester carboxylesterase
MSPIHFSHANGVPAEAYRYLFELLAPHPVSYVPITGGGQAPVPSWRVYAQQLAADIRARHSEPVVGLGHSLGAVLMLFAAQESPELFRQIILLDPPLFGQPARWAIGLLRSLGAGRSWVPIARKALRRRDRFGSLEEAASYWRQRPFFQRFHPRCYEDFVASSLRPEGSGVVLRIPKEVEADIFAGTPGHVGPWPALPIVYVHAREGVVPASVIRRRARSLPQVQFREFEGGHMFPLEAPESAAALLRSLIEAPSSPTA